jgi:hypothetical protein
MAGFYRYPQPTSIIPTIIPTEKAGSRRPPTNAYERNCNVNLLKPIYLCMYVGVRKGTKKCGKGRILAAPQVVTSPENKGDMVGKNSRIPTHILKNSAPFRDFCELALAFSALLGTIPSFA